MSISAGSVEHLQTQNESDQALMESVSFLEAWNWRIKILFEYTFPVHLMVAQVLCMEDLSGQKSFHFRIEMYLETRVQRF